MAEGVVCGCGAEGEDTEEKAKFDCSLEAKTDEDTADDGDKTAADAGPHGQALDKADDEGHFPSEHFEGDTLASFFFAAPADGEYCDSAYEPGEDDGPKSEFASEEVFFNRFFQYDTGSDGR